MIKYLTRALVVMALLAIAVPASAQRRPIGGEDSFRIRLGQFQPDANSGYWNDSFDAFTGSASEFDDISYGADFMLGLGPRSSLMFSGDYYDSSVSQSYRDYVDGFGSPIVHTTKVEVASATAAYVLNFAGRGASVVPYAGIGGGVYDWSLEESGDFIDFGVQPLEIFTDTFRDSNTTLGWFWLAGVDVPLGPRWSIFAEGRWQFVDQDLEGDFATLSNRSFDLSGRHLYGGFAWRF